MRRLKTPLDSEQGAVAVLVALLMVVLLGFAAISIDVAKLYSERAQLQNGADAAALLVAQKCARSAADPHSPADPHCSATTPLVGEIVNRNAVDDVSNVKSTTLDPSTRTVRVTTGAQETGVSTNSVSMVFAGIFGFPTAEVSAQSSATWGSPQAGRSTFPLAISICQVKDKVGGALQLLQNHGKNQNEDCNYGPSGAAVAGGFGWLTSDPGVCGASVNLAESEASSNPGNDRPTQCKAELEGWISDITAGKQVIAYLPVYDNVAATGHNAVYHLTSFAALEVHGWRFSGDDPRENPLPYIFRNNISPATRCVEACRGIIGKFVKYVSLKEGFTMGPVDSSGLTMVRLTL